MLIELFHDFRTSAIFFDKQHPHEDSRSSENGFQTTYATISHIQTFPITGNLMEATVYLEDNEYIALCDLLKLAGLAESGGQAKAFIAEGLVLRNGETETRKTAKIRGGEVIEFDGARLEIADGYDPEE